MGVYDMPKLNFEELLKEEKKITDLQDTVLTQTVRSKNGYEFDFNFKLFKNSMLIDIDSDLFNKLKNISKQNILANLTQKDLERLSESILVKCWFKTKTELVTKEELSNISDDLKDSLLLIILKESGVIDPKKTADFIEES
jgi:hypothetical protein